MKSHQLFDLLFFHNFFYYFQFLILNSHTFYLFHLSKKLLIDVGSGSRFIGNTGKLFDNLTNANIDPESITNVFLTHAHPDHILGIRDDFDETIFPNAEFMMLTFFPHDLQCMKI